MREEELLALVADQSGMVFAANRRAEAEEGIARAMQRAGAAGVDAYLEMIRGDRIGLDRLVDELTIGETHFMRDPDQLQYVRREVLRPLTRRRGAGARVWSAGCATGEEAYTLAILLEEEDLGEGAVVLGTDLSTVALAKARAGSYSDYSLRDMQSRFLQDYFRPGQGRRILVERIRSKVRFERLNFVGPEDYAAAGAFAMDLILCRNVLIYVGREKVGRIAARLFDCLAEGGVLLTAGADPILSEYAPFEVEVTRTGLVYRRPRRAPAGATPPTIPRMTTFAPRSSGRAQRATEGEPPRPTRAPRAPPTEIGREGFERVMSHANARGAEEAERMAEVALRSHPLDAHLHYLRAALLLSLGRDQEAEHEAQRALYLDRSLAIAHFLLGTILRKRGDDSLARRAFRNVRDLCARRPSDEEVPAGAGERAGALLIAASAEMERLEMPSA
jgi:chemotaxis protein methyltransferase CheR